MNLLRSLETGLQGAVKEYLANHNDYKIVPATDAAIVVVSPGIPPSQYPKTNGEIISEIEFSFRILQNKNVHPKIVGVTGTNGKTSVVSGIAHVCNAIACGNIGVPLISKVDSITNDNILVLELSSYQLYTTVTLACDIAIILNISNDHLDWHQSFDAYQQSKLNIINGRMQQHICCPKEMVKKCAEKAFTIKNNRN